MIQALLIVAIDSAEEDEKDGGLRRMPQTVTMAVTRHRHKHRHRQHVKRLYAVFFFHPLLGISL